MTEEIIIDGVDVTGCEYLCTNQMGNNCLNHNRGFSMNCKNTSDCYYKQLKRLEQENKRLNKRLYCYAYEKDCHLQCKQKDCAIKNYYKYKSALEEIREKIKSLNKDICNNCGWYNTDNCQPNGYVCHDLIEIKNKINEVLDNVESK